MDESRSDEVWLLMPVWGETYLTQFLDFCLPSLLAQGNIPTVADGRRCRFVLLTREQDAGAVADHPMWRKLATICRADIEPIDALVSAASAASLTLAYTYAMRQAGDALSQTTFVFLVSDYVLARGALAAAIAEIDAGASGVLTGNFQVKREGIKTGLEGFRDPTTGILSVGAAELVEMGLDQLHSTTRAATIVGAHQAALPYHDPDANRLFWPVGKNALLGKFFLMHMIAIRPEVDSFSVGGPSDHAFIPALCPSGNIVQISDSDRFCVVEMQYADTPANIRFGAQAPARLAEAIAAWATDQHRQNAGGEVLFHAGPVDSKALAAARLQSDSFVQLVRNALPRGTQPANAHRYWPRMLEHFFATATAPASREAISQLLGTAGEDAGSLRGVERMRRALLGRLPQLRPWHPRWADWRLMQRVLAPLVTGKHMLVSAATGQVLRDALTNVAVTNGGTANVVGQHLAKDNYDVCIAEWPDLPRDRRRQWLDEHTALLRDQGTLVVFLCDFSNEAGQAYTPDRIIELQAWIADEPGSRSLDLKDTAGVPVSEWRQAIQTALLSNARSVAVGGKWSAVWRIPVLAVLMAASAISNRLSLARGADNLPTCSCVIATLTIGEATASAARPSRPRSKSPTAFRRAAKHDFKPIFAGGGTYASQG